MENREILLIILSKLEDHWDMAKGLKILLQNNKLQADIVEKILSIMNSEIDKINDKNAQSQFQKSIGLLEKIRKNEREKKYDLGEIEAMLEDL